MGFAMFEKTKDATKTGKEKTKNLAQKSAKKTREIVQQGTTATKEIAQKSALKGKEFIHKGTTATKDFAQKGAAASTDFVKKGATATVEKSKLLTQYTIDRAAEISALLAQADILKWTEEITKQIVGAKSTIYDKALDAEYLKTHIGGGYHRIFDGGHDPISAWEKVRDASADDTFVQEVIGYSSALWKDLVTTMGLPFKTLDQESFNVWAEKITNTIPGLNKSYLYDLVSFDVMELFSTSLGVAGAIFCLKKEDQEKLSEILGAMSIQSIISANPIMGISMIVITAYAYFIKKTSFDRKAMMKSGAVAAVSATLFTIMGFPLLVEFTIIIVLTNLLRKQILDNEQLAMLIKTNTEKAAIRGNKLISTIMLQIQQLTIKPKRNMLTEE